METLTYNGKNDVTVSTDPLNKMRAIFGLQNKLLLP